MVDIIVIGAGAAGMTAALYALRNGKSVTVFEQETFGGQIASSPRVENFPSIKEIAGSAFAENLFEQITALGAQVELERIQKVEQTEEGFRVTGEYGVYEAGSVIIAAGVKHKKLNIDKEEDLTGNGVSYCAICDGAFYTGEEVALVGDGNTALQYALLLSNYCSKVYVYTWFNRFFGDEALVKQLLAKENVEWRPETELIGLEGEEELTAIRYRLKESGEVMTHAVKALFVAIGQVPDNGAYAHLAQLDKAGYFLSDETCTTKTPGLYVAGDCRAKKIRQLTTAVADGANAAMAACAYLDAKRV